MAAEPAGDPFDALGDPNRRAILELLTAGGRSVGELADAMPISRPAVSRHLKLLKDAGLVTEEAHGTRRIYRLHDEGVAAVRAYLEAVWGDVAARFRLAADNRPAAAGGPGAPPVSTPPLDPLEVTVDVACGPADAFATWTERIDLWWPKGHTVSGDPATRVVLEPGVGGRIYERTSDGHEVDWGEVTGWDPPEQLAYLWHIRRDRADATDVVVRFVDRGDGTTRVEIRHSGWERLGAEGPAWRDANRGGWAGLLPHLTDHVAAGAGRRPRDEETA